MRTSKTRALTSACVAAAFTLLPVVAMAGDAIIATVDGKAITESDLNFADQEVGAELGSVPPDMKRRYLAEYLIETQLLANAAEADKLTSGPEFEKRLAYVRQRAAREAYFEKTVRSKVDEAAAKVFYDAQVKQMPAEEEIQARHILVASEAEAKGLVEKITAGGDFAKLASDNSKDAGSKADGGMLGYFGKGQMVPQFEEAAFALKKGEVSKPVQSQFGWHIIKLEDRRQKQPPSFDQVKGQILGSMVKQKAGEALSSLRGKAKIEYVDPIVKRVVEEDQKNQDPMEAQINEMKKQMEQAGEKK